ncbi:hypothetical protein SDC9_140147 [bioreactor metagenome]|uniref:Uncharacterized protein n=1 Tax=bioreactor metagenome TaxID=1076179 RepID=A0A645DUK1_9ZZZZ
MPQRRFPARRKIARHLHPVCSQCVDHLLRLREKRVLISAVDEHSRVIRRDLSHGVHSPARRCALKLSLPRQQRDGFRDHRKPRRANRIHIVIAAVQRNAQQLLLRNGRYAPRLLAERGIGIIQPHLRA